MATRMTVLLPDAIATRLRATAGADMNDYVTRAVRQRLLEEDLAELRDRPPDERLGAEAEFEASDAD
ncbi:Uncharacterised protein [Nocardia otitidiscaviarum]|uniref:Uncharacterized protein n=2 Tax=Nocardia otitidiscaviarum TaxID=1823 RepID=A0A378Y898_9NOCA|nr:Uncharacterised protein [Nocardia otitidiscaviarum]